MCSIQQITHGYKIVRYTPKLKKVQTCAWFATLSDILDHTVNGEYICWVSIPRRAVRIQRENKWFSSELCIERIHHLKDMETCKLLLSEGICPKKYLTMASEKGYFNIVQFLIRQGVNARGVSDYPIEYASRNGHYEIVEYLFEHGAYVHGRDDAPFRWACRNGHYEIVRYLVETAKSNRYVWDYYGMRYARKNNDTKLIDYLEWISAKYKKQNKKRVTFASFTQIE